MKKKIEAFCLKNIANFSLCLFLGKKIKIKWLSSLSCLHLWLKVEANKNQFKTCHLKDKENPPILKCNFKN